MSTFQVTTKVNSQTVNTDIEADSKDNVLNFYNAVSVGEVLELKEYLLSYVTTSKITSSGRYATVTMYFDNGSQQKVKIPSLKHGKNEDDVISLFRSLYSNIKKISVTISSSIR